VPRGLRATGINGAFSIVGVPDGRFVVLASLDNDGLVRDPDPNISGTQIVHLEVVNGVPSLNGFNFKVTEALAVRSPGAVVPEEVSSTPTFIWANDSSEDGYAVSVFDAFGMKIWEKTDIQKSSTDLRVPYSGPELKPGMLYQFRAMSLKSGTPISRTEELRGVFTVK